MDTLSNKPYTIINKCYDGLNIISMTIKTEQGETKLVKYEDIIKLARAEKISNAKAILDTGQNRYILCLDGSIKDIETIYKNNSMHLEILCRLIDNKGKCIGYKVRDNKGKLYKLSIQKTWELAVNNTIEGVKGRIISNHKVIISNDEQLLKNLPKLVE